MKFITIIISIYLLMLSGLPCADWADCNTNEIASINNASHNHKESDDHCSPFCTCACCGQVITQPTTFNFPAVGIPVFSTKIATYTHTLLPHFSFDVWQPPRAIN